MAHADGARRLRVRANADTAGGRRAGPPLRRRGHRPVPHRAHVPRRATRAGRAADRGRRTRQRRRRRWTRCCRCSARTSPRSSRRWTACRSHPADRPAAARVPARPRRARRSRSPWPRTPRRAPRSATSELLDAVEPLHEQNPMLGPARRAPRARDPGLSRIQARAILEAAADRSRPAATRGQDHDPAGRRHVTSSSWSRAEIDAGRRRGRGGARASRSTSRFGTMIEVPRAALTADEIAESADFFSFGTNDLTQMTFGFSRDDVEAAFFSSYVEHGHPAGQPVRDARRRGVGELVQIGGREGPRDQARPQARRLRRARRRPRVDPLLRRGRASTTCRARRSGCRSPGSRPAARRSGRGTQTERLRLRRARSQVLARGARAGRRCRRPRRGRAGGRGPCCGRRRRYGATRSTSRSKASSTWPPSMSRSATRVCASTSSGRRPRRPRGPR